MIIKHYIEINDYGHYAPARSSLRSPYKFLMEYSTGLYIKGEIRTNSESSLSYSLVVL